jgi:hypothetical protein
MHSPCHVNAIALPWTAKFEVLLTEGAEQDLKDIFDMAPAVKVFFNKTHCI